VEHVIISNRLADLRLLTAAFAFGRGKIFDGQILTPAAYSRLPYGGQIFLRVTFVDLQLDAQNFYLFTYNTFIKILYMFRALP
jgi:hypothetical protein